MIGTTRETRQLGILMGHGAWTAPHLAHDVLPGPRVQARALTGCGGALVMLSGAASGYPVRRLPWLAGGV
jgi:hypothetical protein